VLQTCNCGGRARTTSSPLLTAPLPGPRLPRNDEADVRRKLQSTADAWNRADLAGHVAPHADSAAFMTGRGPMIGRDISRTATQRGIDEVLGRFPIQEPTRPPASPACGPTQCVGTGSPYPAKCRISVRELMRIRVPDQT
jgi:hypothetical protein